VKQHCLFEDVIAIDRFGKVKESRAFDVRMSDPCENLTQHTHISIRSLEQSMT
jgi:hypothetical protein